MAAVELPQLQLDAAARARADAAADPAAAALDARHYELAEQQARDILDQAPRQARARAVLGLCLQQRASLVTPPDLRLQNTGEGEVLLAAKLAPADPVVGRLHVQFLLRVGHASAAAVAGEAVLAQLPRGDDVDYVALLALCGECRYELGEERLARPHLLALVDLRPDDAIASFRLGICLLRTAADEATVARQIGRAQDAAAAFQRASALAPGDEDAALAVGRAYARAAEFDGGNGRDQALTLATTAFAAAAAKFTDSAEACFCQGVALQGRDLHEAAAQAFEEALRRDPDHLGALLDLALLRAAEPAVAQALLRRALALGDRGPQRLTAAERARIETFLRDAGDGR